MTSYYDVIATMADYSKLELGELKRILRTRLVCVEDLRQRQQYLVAIKNTPATDRVLGIEEPREMIMLQIPMRNLLLSQRVSREWKDTIGNSPKLQQKLFFKPTGQKPLIFNATTRTWKARLPASTSQDQVVTLYRNPVLEQLRKLEIRVTSIPHSKATGTVDDGSSHMASRAVLTQLGVGVSRKLHE